MFKNTSARGGLRFPAAHFYAIACALMLMSCDRQDRQGNASAYVNPTAAAVGDPETGLDFPNNGQTSADIRFRFTGTNVLPMYPATYVWRANIRQHAGRYSIFFWSPDEAFYGVNYYGARPYPDGDDKSNSTSHKWSIAADGGDPTYAGGGVSTQLGHGEWKTQAFRAYDNGVYKVHEYYFDLPDTTKVIRQYVPRSYGNNPPSNAALTFGANPGDPWSQRLGGVIRGIQVYKSSLPLPDVLNEATAPMSTPAGSANVWYVNVNPTPEDISDKSGQGHNPAWVTSARAGLWTGGATPPPAPTVSLTSNPSSVPSGSASTLTWSSSNAASCDAGGDWTGSMATSGSQSTGTLTSNKTYTLTCTGPGGTAGQTATVTVTANPAPTVTLAANPDSIKSGSASTLTWSSTNATSCNASGNWTGSKATGGTQSTGNLTSNKTYTLTCTGPGGTAGQTATVSVTANPAPTVTLAANPASINSGSASTLTWSTANATSCNASGSWNGSKATSGSQSTNNLTSNKTYTLTCTGPGGSANKSVTVTVTSNPVPSVTLTASPGSVSSGASSTLAWSSANATSCNATGGWTGSKATSGNQSTGALAATTTYTLTCTGAGGSANKSVTVTVSTPAPTVSISANPSTISSGESSTLTWSSTNATSCNASGAWTGSKSASGSLSGSPTATSTYTLTCTGPGGSANQSATVTVEAPPGGGGTTGLNFPSNDEGWNDVRFRFKGSALIPMYPATYIWRVNLRQQPGYYTTFFWGPDGSFTGQGYYGCHPYPDGDPKNSSTSHKWELSINGWDPVTDANGHSTQLGYDTWKTQAMRVWDNGELKVHEFFWDLPDMSKVIRVELDRNYGPPSNPALTFGTAPWAPQAEHLSGILRGIQLYATNLSDANILAEANNPLSTSAGSANIWYLNLNPTPSDISDKSGKGHHPEWVNSGRPALWTGP